MPCPPGPIVVALLTPETKILEITHPRVRKEKSLSPANTASPLNPIVEISGKDIDIIYDTSKPEGDKGRCADYSRARQILGWKPRVNLKEGLTQLYRWIEERVSN